jgi:hypothetical protein
MSEDLTTETTALVDTNLLVAVGGPSNAKYSALREYVEERNVVLKVPRRVEKELSTMHYGDRVETAVREGWAERIDPPSPTDSAAVDAMDFVRREIANQTGKDEHDVEKADTALAGLAVEYLERGDGPVAVLTDDRVAARAIEMGTARSDCTGSVSVFTRDDLIGDDDDDLRIL